MTTRGRLMAHARPRRPGPRVAGAGPRAQGRALRHVDAYCGVVVEILGICVDTPDPPALARFWAAALGAPISYEWADFVVVGAAPLLHFQYVADPTPGKNRIHVDLCATDAPAEIERLRGLGARLLARVQMREAAWTVMADPDDNEFCVYDRLTREETAPGPSHGAVPGPRSH